MVGWDKALLACITDAEQADSILNAGHICTHADHQVQSGNMPSVGTAWLITKTALTPCITQKRLLTQTAHATQARAP